ncbi:MAG TPA: methyltransferase domain-containing protein [Flavihumibacter sp.]|nr:class I SAM-dependent methyltransferase [Bacteroidota bacterium]HPZ86867.1 methyltransferase domain-containing protein [Flavihumibacter sp.]
MKRAAHYFESDASFNSLYPDTISQHARRHWTPLKVAKIAADFLRSGSGNKVLDIGSGAGKFCLTAAWFHPDTLYYGIEQRAWLVEAANLLRDQLAIPNVQFDAGNIKDLNLQQYDHFYFYNAFYENLAEAERIDDEIGCSTALYEQYSYHLYKQFRQCPAGTRLVTYHSLESEIPAEFHLVHTHINDYLKCWIKV